MLLSADPTYVERLERSFSQDLWPILIYGQFGNATKGTVYKFFDGKQPTRSVKYDSLPRCPNGSQDRRIQLLCHLYHTRAL